MNFEAIHLGSRLDPAVLDAIADIICGDDTERYPEYRSSYYLTKFFSDAGVKATHDGSTRKKWVVAILQQLTPQDAEKVILRLANLKEYKGDMSKLKQVTRELNNALAMDNFKVSYINNQPQIIRAQPIVIDDDVIASHVALDEKQFLEKQFSEDISISDLGIDAVLTDYLQDRVNEIQSIPKNKVHLGTIFLLGSTLEGILLAVALKTPAKYMASKSAPKDNKSGKTKKLYDWTLNDLINVSYDVGHVSKDVKEFASALRDFRNYVHPYHQMSQAFKPNQNTIDICWHVFKAAFSQLKDNA